jgi:hypothetical protein
MLQENKKNKAKKDYVKNHPLDDIARFKSDFLGWRKTNQF